MVKDMKLVDLVLKSYVNGTIDDLDKKCAANAACCEGVAITEDQEYVLADVLHDGVIKEEEKALISFLPSTVVNGIAGDDGNKPARMKAKVLSAKLRSADVNKIPELVYELVDLGDAVRAQAEPVVKAVMGKLKKTYSEKVVRHILERLDEIDRGLKEVGNWSAHYDDPALGMFAMNVTESDLERVHEERRRLEAAIPPAARAVMSMEAYLNSSLMKAQ